MLFCFCVAFHRWILDDMLYVRIFRQYAHRLSFCILNIFVHMQTDVSQSCVAEIRLSFFNVPAPLRAQEARDLQKEVWICAGEEWPGDQMPCEDAPPPPQRKLLQKVIVAFAGAPFPTDLGGPNGRSQLISYSISL